MWSVEHTYSEHSEVLEAKKEFMRKKKKMGEHLASES